MFLLRYEYFAPFIAAAPKLSFSKSIFDVTNMFLVTECNFFPMEYEAKLNDCKTKTAPYFGHSLKCSNFPAFMLERHDENNKNQRTLIMCVVNKFTTVNIKPSQKLRQTHTQEVQKNVAMAIGHHSTCYEFTKGWSNGT